VDASTQGVLMKDGKNMKTDSWRIWDRQKEYGDLLYRRAVGELPEMESSKAVAARIQPWLQSGDRVLDVGCGAGHYYRSLKQAIPHSFHYTGVDATGYYIEVARRAWKGDPATTFVQGDIFALPFEDQSFDIVVSANVFLHLPSIKIPFEQLVRVARRKVLVRMLAGDRSFRIQEVYSPETHPGWFTGQSDQEEFDGQGEPVSFHYFNIYSRSYIEKILGKIPRVTDVRFIPDTFFDAGRFTAEKELYAKSPDATTILDGWQVNGYILQPWHFVEVTCG